MAIIHQIRPKFNTRNEEIVAKLFEIAGADAPLDPEYLIKRKCDEIATVMAMLHGGEWRIQIEPEAGFVQIARRLPKSPRSPARGDE